MSTLLGAALLAMASMSQIAYLAAHRRRPDPTRAAAPSVRSFRFVYPLVMLALFGTACDLLATGGEVTRTLPMPPAIAALGLAGMVLGSALFVWARRSLGLHYSPCFASLRPHEVVRHGAYRWLRHPMYVGNLTAIAGAAVASGSLVLGAAWVLVAVAYCRAARDEDGLLRVVAARVVAGAR
jgi:protein-S-isoprenylcysteine O-methyltransferase Ste14